MESPDHPNINEINISFKLSALSVALSFFIPVVISKKEHMIESDTAVLILKIESNFSIGKNRCAPSHIAIIIPKKITYAKTLIIVCILSSTEEVKMFLFIIFLLIGLMLSCFGNVSFNIIPIVIADKI